ncbi:Nicotianamine synthase [Zalerion maritima]|uniref:Nicotianamine synthase n=1 Tax=Zalerion maritima TaxID=339359 RepID=A0AAD5RL49_9PEZI|nr:Nicotianamine synthase [Zalerion maritima]
MGIYEDTALSRVAQLGPEFPVCNDSEAFIQQIKSIYSGIAQLPSLSPSPDANCLFSSLVYLCRQPIAIDVATISAKAQAMRIHLIKLCAQAEGLLERHFSGLLASRIGNPLDDITLFPYYDNYLKLGHLEYSLLTAQLERLHTLPQTMEGADCLECQMNRERPGHPKSIAFLGSGPLPLTSIVLAKHHFLTTKFYNYDMDPEANSMALKIIYSDGDLCQRMSFHTADVMDLTRTQLGEHDVVYLAALVGMDAVEKDQLIKHLAQSMKPNSLLMLRSAHGARAFLYPVVEMDTLKMAGFEVLSVFHPQDEVINSVVIARKMAAKGLSE